MFFSVEPSASEINNQGFYVLLFRDYVAVSAQTFDALCSVT